MSAADSVYGDWLSGDALVATCVGRPSGRSPEGAACRVARVAAGAQVLLRIAGEGSGKTARPTGPVPSARYAFIKLSVRWNCPTCDPLKVP